MIILGIDFGTKNIGLAVSDETALVAGALPILQNYGLERAVMDVAGICRQRRVERILLGVPMRANNPLNLQNDDISAADAAAGQNSAGNVNSEKASTDSKMALEIKQFGEKLAELSGISVVHWDESYSSSMVESKLRGKARKASDSLVAQMLLQQYLDHLRETRRI